MICCIHQGNKCPSSAAQWRVCNKATELLILIKDKQERIENNEDENYTMAGADFI